MAVATGKVKCEAKTASGKRCQRNAKVSVTNVEYVPVFWILRKRVETVSNYCRQHEELPTFGVWADHEE